MIQPGSLDPTLNIGDVAVIVATAIYALYSTLLRKRPGMTAVSFVALTMGLGAVLLSPVALADRMAGARFAPLDAGSLPALFYVVLFPSVLAYLRFNRDVQLIGANRAGPFFHFVPLFGALLAVVFLDERPGFHHGAGVLFILGSVIAASRGRGKPPGIGWRRNPDAPSR